MFILLQLSCSSTALLNSSLYKSLSPSTSNVLLLQTCQATFDLYWDHFRAEMSNFQINIAKMPGHSIICGFLHDQVYKKTLLSEVLGYLRFIKNKCSLRFMAMYNAFGYGFSVGVDHGCTSTHNDILSNGYHMEAL